MLPQMEHLSLDVRRRGPVESPLQLPYPAEGPPATCGYCTRDTRPAQTETYHQ